jgi:hypothetical protein
MGAYEFVALLLNFTPTLDHVQHMSGRELKRVERFAACVKSLLANNRVAVKYQHPPSGNLRVKPFRVTL